MSGLSFGCLDWESAVGTRSTGSTVDPRSEVMRSPPSTVRGGQTGPRAALAPDDYHGGIAGLAYDFESLNILFLSPGWMPLC